MAKRQRKREIIKTASSIRSKVSSPRLRLHQGRKTRRRKLIERVGLLWDADTTCLPHDWGNHLRHRSEISISALHQQTHATMRASQIVNQSGSRHEILWDDAESQEDFTIFVPPQRSALGRIVEGQEHEHDMLVYMFKMHLIIYLYEAVASL